ncbi:rhodanese-like domain-containing protein [Clostridium sp. UBA7503]|uniref:rhodanese-like domain-containing protein n=1 Tax=Clostridium sp. UBA7503 TaxID=1946377 RepID=UPI003216BF77
MFNFLKRDNGKVININNIDSLLGKINLIDIREIYEYRNGSLKTARNIPMGNLLNNPDRYLKKENEYYLMCETGSRSSLACRRLNKEGFNVINVRGGIGAYRGTKGK